MKSRFLTILAVAFVFGCSKKPTGGTVASNAPTNTAAATATATGSTTGSPTSTAGSPTPSATATGGTAVGSTPAAPSATTGTATAPNVTKPGAAPMTGSKTTPGPGGAAIQTTPGAPPPGTPPQLTPEQKKQQQEFIAKMQQQQKESAAKAEKATRSIIPGVSGNYVGYIDETKITPEMRKRPNFDQILAKAKEDIKKATLTIAANGDIVVKGISPDPVNGFTAKVDGKPGVVVLNPKPQAGQPDKQFATLAVKNSGDIIVLGSATFKRVQ